MLGSALCPMSLSLLTLLPYSPEPKARAENLEEEETNTGLSNGVASINVRDSAGRPTPSGRIQAPLVSTLLGANACRKTVEKDCSGQHPSKIVIYGSAACVEELSNRSAWDMDVFYERRAFLLSVWPESIDVDVAAGPTVSAQMLAGAL
ncbi:hypothetical protein CYLTODRAFT_476144 [Cylindrobasidium torrendii FP15055 ss-10]|uniref:Uncharacterized protein n=1 Tax=Cylindrobasidium torrendii FP15055 ss-10 TaxID=1314674 RepID=A0A0D7AUK0_9AGAR|nr:hypothetical protein CYLTODRAFT_476144 [Cylindrobasidium torrendii FP15055 ss-10]